MNSEKSRTENSIYYIFLPTFAWSVYSFVNSLIYKEIFFGLCFTLVVSLIYFVFFAFLSYEFGRMDSSVGFDECCSAIKFGRVKTIGARILVMISLSIPCFILNLLFLLWWVSFAETEQLQHFMHLHML